MLKLKLHQTKLTYFYKPSVGKFIRFNIKQVYKCLREANILQREGFVKEFCKFLTSLKLDNS